MDDAAAIVTALGQRLRAARLTAGLSQEKLAFRADVTSMTVSRIERGLTWPSPPTLLALAVALGIPVTRLLSDANGDESTAA
jgi:transcriptional regulator with XRE-family HTH domain